MSLWSLIVKVKGDNSGLKTTLNDSEKQVGVFGSAIKKLGGVLAAAFAVDKIVAFGKEVVQVASKAEGIRAAFQDLGGGQYLDALRKSTRGTVTDLELMQRLVQANNFKIPLTQLATYFEFATKRALATGQSVDYLVDSIVTGIGRKSVLIMDNLGISSVALQTEIAKVGDFGIASGNIIRRELSSMGDVADTTATKISAIGTSLANLKEALGQKINQSGFFKDILEGTTLILNAVTPKDQSKFTGMNRDQLVSTQIDLEAKKNDLFTKLEDTQYLINRTKNKRDRKKLESDLSIWEKDIETVKKDLDEVNKLISEIDRLKKLASTVIDERDIQKAPTPVPIPGMKSVRTAIKGTAQKALEKDNFGLRGVITQTERELTEMEKLLRSGVDMASSIGGQMAEALGAALASGDFESLGKELLASFANFLSQFGSMLIAYGIANSAFYKSLTAGPEGAPMAIAAGTALMVTAGAIKGVMSKAASGGINTSSSYGNSQMQTIKVQVEGKVKGKDLGIVLQRNGY